MVRLKLNKEQQYTLEVKGSQFHYGSIKTWFENRDKFDGIESQFHYGSIKTKYCC